MQSEISTQQSDQQRAADDLQDQMLQIIYDSLSKGIIPKNLPEELANNPKLTRILSYIGGVQQGVIYLSKGDLTTPIPVREYMGGLLKSIQSNLRHIVWKTQHVSAGVFTEKIDFMGELAESFNRMVSDLQKARSELEEQKDNLLKLSEELQREIEARKIAENQLKQEEDRQRKLASTDMLTGALNRRGFFQQAHREISRMQRTRESSSLALIDLDYFKKINDDYGHLVGDKALCFLADLLKDMLREYDIIGRFGGDEFVVFFPETSVENAFNILERVREKLQTPTEEIMDAGPVKISISAGVAKVNLLQDFNDSIDAAIETADQALYQSKQLGRNRISKAA